MQRRRCPKCQSHQIRPEEGQFLCDAPTTTDPYMLLWECLNQGCKYIWAVEAFHFNKTIGAQIVTKIQAAYLEATWNELGSPLCEHRKIDLERSEDGYVTGNYRCMACGEAMAR